MGEIRDTLLKSLRDNPDIIKKLEMEESDEKTKTLLKMILEQIQGDPEYAGVNHYASNLNRIIMSVITKRFEYGWLRNVWC